MQEPDRMATHDTVAAALSSMSDQAIHQLLEDRGPWRGSIGGATRSIEVAGFPVFVKTVRVSDRELAAGPGDTRNLFGLPPWYQYGVGKCLTGFSVWREVAAHEMANEWVVTDERAAFPILHHWRIIHGVDQLGASEAEDQACGELLGGLGRGRNAPARAVNVHDCGRHVP